jgi:hypothetical protein
MYNKNFINVRLVDAPRGFNKCLFNLYIILQGKLRLGFHLNKDYISVIKRFIIKNIKG